MQSMKVRHVPPRLFIVRITCRREFCGTMDACA